MILKKLSVAADFKTRKLTWIQYYINNCLDNSKASFYCNATYAKYKKRTLVNRS